MYVSQSLCARVCVCECMFVATIKNTQSRSSTPIQWIISRSLENSREIIFVITLPFLSDKSTHVTSKHDDWRRY